METDLENHMVIMRREGGCRTAQEQGMIDALKDHINTDSIFCDISDDIVCLFL
jgi:hypothetical protein